MLEDSLRYIIAASIFTRKKNTRKISNYSIKKSFLMNRIIFFFSGEVTSGIPQLYDGAKDFSYTRRHFLKFFFFGVVFIASYVHIIHGNSIHSARSVTVVKKPLLHLNKTCRNIYIAQRTIFFFFFLKIKGQI